MGQSLPIHFIHITFSTKARKAMIHPPFEKGLHAYITGICNNLECRVLKVGGYTDHIHILCMHSPKITFMALMQKIKANSSKWMKTRDESLKNFSWQRGYGSFSGNPTETEIVIKYIDKVVIKTH
ncbi:IS200/IS605 family transposase [Brumimicrobium mesophilum]|uniref:IS200/IS605 family transposase n=1 Tax=Brumimicrobium mesophilum TaxID=392717 RepID=UPI000D1416AF|nr:IS200/IS605 family transposase [Brumimicrobium mesophilum]